MFVPAKYSYDLNTPLIFYCGDSLMSSPNCLASPARGVVTFDLLQDAVISSPSEAGLSRSYSVSYWSSGLKEKRKIW